MPGQTENQPPPIDPGYDSVPDIAFDFNPLTYLYHPGLLIHHPAGIVTVGFWLWMVVHCVRNDPERGMWLWILIVFPPSVVIYFLLRWLPGGRVSTGASIFNRWTKRREIPRLEAAARNIGNAHQFVELGEAYRETGKPDRAAECFAKALEKDAESLPALWGAAQVAMRRNDFVAAREHIDRILAKDGSYKFGDVSLAGCRCLCSLGENSLAHERLEQHLKRWTHPEAYVLLGTILIDGGDHPAAQRLLETMILDLRGSPAFFVRQNRGWERKAKRLLAKIPK